MGGREGGWGKRGAWPVQMRGAEAGAQAFRGGKNEGRWARVHGQGRGPGREAGVGGGPQWAPRRAPPGPSGGWGLQEGPSGLPASPPLQVTRHPWSPGQGQRAPRGRAGNEGHSSVRSRGPEPGPLAAPQGTARASARGRLFNRAPTPPVDHRPGEPAPIHAFPTLLQTGNAPLL